jgi:hypothetical protein
MFHGFVSRPWFVRFCTALLLGPMVACTVTAARPPDPLVGTWTLNTQRSKFRPGVPPQSMTVTYEQTATGLHAVSVVVLRDGTSSRSEYTAAYDGKDYPITGVAKVDTVSMRQIDALTSERIDKLGGKRMQSYLRQVYADGHQMVVTQKGTDAMGTPVDHLMIFEKK